MNKLKFSKMKNSILTFLLISFALFSVSAQTTLILDNSSNDPMHYKTFAEAIEAATAKSTILVHGSGVSYGDITIDKEVYIKGPGFYIGENPGTENMSTATAKFGAVNVSIDGGGASLSGLNIEGICTIKGEKTVVQRNQIRAVKIDNANDIIIGQNSIYGFIKDCSGSGSEIGSLHITGNNNNIMIHNNYINGKGGCLGFDDPLSVEASANSTITFKNNVFLFGGSFSNSVLENNIIIDGNTPDINDNNKNVYHNNVFLKSKPGLIGVNNNITNAGSLDDIFTREGKTLTRFTIRDDSIAKGAGNDGTDAGIFGGAEPFVPSGIPGIPTVYSIEIPTNVNDDNLKVKVKARTNN